MDSTKYLDCRKRSMKHGGRDKIVAFYVDDNDVTYTRVMYL